MFTNPYSERDDVMQHADEMQMHRERFAEAPRVRTFSPEFCQFSPGVVTGYREQNTPAVVPLQAESAGLPSEPGLVGQSTVTK